MASTPIVSFYGRGCDSHDCNGLKCGLRIAPTAYLVERDGRVLRVCTRCLLESDRVIEILADENARYEVYERYDPVGAIQLVAKLTARAYATHEAVGSFDANALGRPFEAARNGVG